MLTVRALAKRSSCFLLASAKLRCSRLTRNPDIQSGSSAGAALGATTGAGCDEAALRSCSHCRLPHIKLSVLPVPARTDHNALCLMCQTMFA